MEQLSQHHAWVHPEKARYYQVYLDLDLFGHWTLRKVWGGIDSHRGGMHNTGITSYDAGIEQIEKLAKLRRRHGYRQVGGHHANPA